MTSPVKVCDLGAAKLPTARHKVIAEPPPIFFVYFCIRTLLSFHFGRLVRCLPPGECARIVIPCSPSREFAQDATVPHERHPNTDRARLPPSSDAMAAPNARWAARTVAAKCHPKFTPNKPTPNPCTTGLIRNPTPTAIP